MKVVSNSTVLIGLAKIGKLELLKEIFGEIYIPEAVFDEVVVKGKGKLGVTEVKKAAWVQKKTVRDRKMVEMLAGELGRGEAEVLTLGKELEADWLVIDEEKARNAAFFAGFNVIGLAGLLVLAKDLKLISKVKPFLENLRKKKFRISNEIYQESLRKAKEI